MLLKSKIDILNLAKKSAWKRMQIPRMTEQQILNESRVIPLLRNLRKYSKSPRKKVKLRG